MTPTVVSLFCGCGGSSLGYKLAGYHVRLAVDFDSSACATYRKNFPDTPVFEGDIAKLHGEEAIRMSGVVPGELDVLDGSPPCQGFSTAGKRNVGDGRNRLFEEYIRLLKTFRPKAFVMENVSGLIKGKMKIIFAEMTRALKGAGYRVSCRLLNAWWYGVPQDRRRLIWVGIREDLDLQPGHPKPTQRKPITVSEALGISIMTERRTASKPKPGKAPRFVSYFREGEAPMLPAMKPPKVMERHEPQVLEAWEASAPGQSLRKARRYVGSFQSVRLDASKPSPTQIAAHRNWRWDEPRYLTVDEAKILQGFPRDFQIKEYRLIGNSVPPPMAEAIGNKLMEILSISK